MDRAETEDSVVLDVLCPSPAFNVDKKMTCNYVKKIIADQS